jgi:hypothetical protein
MTTVPTWRPAQCTWPTTAPGQWPSAEAARACMRPTRLGALAAGACVPMAMGRHDRPRHTTPLAAAHSGTDSDTRAFGGDGTHRQRLDGGGVDRVDGRRRWRSDTRDSAATCAVRRRRGEAAGNRSMRRQKGVSAVVRRRGERWRHGVAYPQGRRRARAAAVARDFRPRAATRCSNMTVRRATASGGSRARRSDRRCRLRTWERRPVGALWRGRARSCVGPMRRERS